MKRMLVTRRPPTLAVAAVCLLAGGMLPTAEAATGNPASVPSVVVPLDPVRILDTRTGVGIGATAVVAPDQTITLQVTGVAAIPAEAAGPDRPRR